MGSFETNGLLGKLTRTIDKLICLIKNPEPIPVEGLNCDETTSSTEVTSVVQSIPHPDFVQRVTLCNSGGFDKTILCDKNTFNKVIVVTSYSELGVPTSIAYNIDGSLYTGDITTDLVTCDIDLESDEIIICIEGEAAVQWVVKKDGIPTGEVYYTDKTGQLITAPTDFTIGECPDCTNIQSQGTLVSWDQLRN